MNAEPDIRIPRPLAWIFSGLFLAVLLVPALCRLLRIDYETPPRQALQRALTFGIREGNRQVVFGRYGWLYYRPEIDALTGYGPTAREPDSVAKDPQRLPWTPPKKAILDFARQLRERRVELILVPIPSKPMILPEHLTGNKLDHPLTHPAAEAFFTELRSNQIQVIDPAPLFMSLKAGGQDVYLHQHTHWRPQAMEETALLVAEHLRSRPWFVATPRKFRLQTWAAHGRGDLLEKLGIPDGFPELVTIRQVYDLESDEPVDIHDPASPIVLLGDSFTNIYSAPSLGWGEHGGFAEHLARCLNLTLDTIAENGGGSTGVRETLARRPDALKSKRAVVWAIAARDLMLAESMARETGVTWEKVEFIATPAVAGDAVVMEAEVIAASKVPDPTMSPYPSTIITVKYRVLKVRQGEFPAPEVLVLHWGYRDRKLSAESNLKPGDQRMLTLVPYLSKPELFPENKTDQLEEDNMVMYWAEKVK